MTKVLTFSITIASILFLASCDNTKKQVELEWKVFRSVVEHNDVSTAVVSLNRIIALEKYNADALDTLSILYYKAGMNNAALKIATRALSVRESDQVTAVLARSNKNLGNFDQAIGGFTKLLEKSPEDLNLLYEVAFSNINLKKPSEALPYIQKIIAHPNSGSEVMTEFYQNSSQLVPYKAVALNMLGFLQAQAGQKEDAVKSYQAALSIFPKYYLAQNNLKVLSAKE